MAHFIFLQCKTTLPWQDSTRGHIHQAPERLVWTVVQQLEAGHHAVVGASLLLPATVACAPLPPISMSAEIPNLIFIRKYYFHKQITGNSWFGDRKDIRPVKSWVLVCLWLWFDWSFARLATIVVTTTSIILGSNKIKNGDIQLGIS